VHFVLCHTQTNTLPRREKVTKKTLETERRTKSHIKELLVVEACGWVGDHDEYHGFGIHDNFFKFKKINYNIKVFVLGEDFVINQFVTIHYVIVYKTIHMYYLKSVCYNPLCFLCFITLGPDLVTNQFVISIITHYVTA
jgi:hypothetical protein